MFNVSSHRRERTLRPRTRRALFEAMESRRLLSVAALESTAVTIWDGAAIPTVDADADAVPIEVGVKFRADVAGDVTGIRFYKGATNTGTHVGNLWSSGGTLLATATFAGETDSGWQTVTFDAPVTILENTTYVVSYHTDTGHYASDAGYFTAAGVDNAPLHALASGVDGGNGVYVYGASAFPTETFQGTNYWVDVTFSPTPIATGPAAPTDLAATPASSTEIDLAWTDNATDETGYRVERSTDNVTFTEVATLGADATGYADTGLDPSTHYYYRVFAANGAGDSDASNTADATTSATPVTTPAAPTGLGASAVSASEIHLVWVDSATDETGYRVERSTDNVAFTPVTTLAADATTYADTGLAAATHYYYRVFAVNGAGDSDPSNTADATTLAPSETTPAGPTDLGATAVSSSEIDLAWTDNATDETGYRVERSTDNVTFVPIATLAANVTSHADTGLSPSTAYYYRVFAVNGVGDSDASNTADATTSNAPTTTPAGPTGLGASTASSSEIDLTWTDNATDETGYRVERSTDNVTFTPVATVGAGATSYPDTGLSASTHYYYRVIAVNAAGDSAPSNTADATTLDNPTPPPTGTPVKLTGTPIGSEGSWNNSGNTFDKAMDGNVNTYFDAPTADGNFVGLTLAEPAVITSAQIFPRWNFSWRVTGAKIQGSNDNLTWTDLATIATQPAAGTFTTVTISDPTPYKYVRYLSPTSSFGNIAEVEFYTGETQPPPTEPPPTGTPVKLTGTAIGSEGSWNNSGNTFDKALDGDTRTFFDAPTAAGNFVGLYLGTATVLTSVNVYPRAGFAWRLAGAKIQGSVNESVWADLATITTQPADGTFTTITITDPTAYKYVRFLSPDEGFGNVAELEFYGLSNDSNPPPPPTNPFKLTGTPIGTEGSWNGSGNTFDKALDGNVNTFFDAQTGSGNFVGLTLTTPAVLTSARIFPRWNFSRRATGARIQGSNDNSTWTDLATVTTQPAEGTFSTLAITDPTAYRYVRYLSPADSYGNIAEVEFYGSPA